jgi:hypothetical protein
MIKIIDGTRYNTDTAMLVARHDSGNPASASSYTEELYLTPKGAWFLAGRGGPPSRYGEEVGGILQCGSTIIPMSPSEARGWLEEHDEVKALEEHFGQVIVDA